MAKRRITWNDSTVAKLPVKATRYAAPDPQMPGLYVRVQPSGAKSYVAVALTPNKRQVWTTFGDTRHLSLAEAREKARETIVGIKQGKPPVTPKSFETVANEWLKRYVDKEGLRSKPIIRFHLSRMVEAWGDRDFTSIKRS